MKGLKLARQNAGYTQAEASDVSGVPLSTLRRWEQGVNEPDVESINMLADLYNCSTDFILGSKFAEKQVVLVSDETLPVFGRIVAGTPMEALEQNDEVYWVSPELKKRYPKGFWLKVSGNSMNRLFPDQSLVLIDKTTDVKDGEVAAVMVNGYDATIKRIFFEPSGAIRLHPESHDPEYRDTVIDKHDPDAPYFQIIGKAVSYTAPDGWRA